MNASSTLSFSRPAALLSLAILFALPLSSSAAATCTFTTDLTLGTENAAVKCLQQYLNANGYVISEAGVGSVGHETPQFKEKTLAAVKKWQVANGITPATGTFGAKSRAKYKELMSGTAATTTPSTTPTIPVPPTPTVPPTPIPTPTSTPSVEESTTRAKLKTLQRAYDAAQSDYTTAHDNQDSTGQSKAYLATALTSLVKAYTAFVAEDYATSQDYIAQSTADVTSAADELGGSSSTAKASAQSAYDAALAKLKTTSTAVDAANAKGKNTNKADSYIADARSSMSDAKSSIKSKDYQDAISFVNDALGFISKAKGAI